ncbi:MAG: hypothetical protein JWP37_3635 [Mucilaginibacter sp.]|nr:hypothetical protein [Mucilaginibacter sp.]
MKTSIDHLPEVKKKEIAEIVKIIIEISSPEKIILFGSHARGDWTEDTYIENRAIFSYISDYDFLIVIKKNGQKEYEIVSKIVNGTAHYINSLSPIVHDIEYVNYGLARGQYFFTDIVKEGILVYDTNSYQFSEPKPLTTYEQKEDAEFYFNEWCESGLRLLELTKVSFELALKKSFVFNEVVFLLHQTTEKLYAGVSLIFTGYKPKTHNLNDFRKYTKYISDELNQAFCFPKGDAEQVRLFDILQKSYIDARYKPNYNISKEDLVELIKKVENLKEIIVRICKERINSFNK